MKKIRKYKAAYLDKNANPRKIPTNKDEKLEFCLNDINKKNKQELKLLNPFRPGIIPKEC